MQTARKKNQQQNRNNINVKYLSREFFACIRIKRSGGAIIDGNNGKRLKNSIALYLEPVAGYAQNGGKNKNHPAVNQH
jgi:hypothetical protein